MVTVTSIKSFSKKESLIFATAAILWNAKKSNVKMLYETSFSQAPCLTRIFMSKKENSKKHDKL